MHHDVTRHVFAKQKYNEQISESKPLKSLHLHARINFRKFDFALILQNYIYAETSQYVILHMDFRNYA